jgi:toxin ParE1/3/4
MSVVFREEALADLEETSRHISQSDPRQSHRVIQRIYDVIFGTLELLPLAGRVNRADNTREFAVPGLPYLIIYVPVGDLIDVVAIFHTWREPASKRRP